MSDITIPFETLIGKAITEPVLSTSIQNTLAEALVPITHKKRWEKWEMDRQGRRGTKLLLVGPPGCGKTTVAYWLAKKVSNSIITLTMADIGSSEPGSSERHVKDVFQYAVKKEATIFFEECDSMLWSREHAGSDSMWMIGVINQLLIQIERYNRLIILATNFSHILDPALRRRLSYIVEIPKPDLSTRVNLWIQKIPEYYPFQPTERQVAELAKYELTGSDIESVIDRVTRRALREGHNPTFNEMLMAAFQFNGTNSKTKTRKIVKASSSRT